MTIEERVEQLEHLVEALRLVRTCPQCGHVPSDHRTLGERATCWNNCPCILTRYEASRT